MSILKQLFDGDYYPSETVVPTAPEYTEAKKVYNVAYDKLVQTLGNEGDEVLTEFLDAQANVTDWMNYEFFLEGIRFGIAFSAELGAT